MLEVHIEQDVCINKLKRSDYTLTDTAVADLVYPPVIVAIKLFWKYLGLKFDSEGEENIPRKEGAILSLNHIG